MADQLFFLSARPLEMAPPFALPPSLGALVTFDGVVRDNNMGKPVVRLEYTAYPALAEREGTRILREAIARFTLLAACCVHRTGVLEVGEVAVKVWAAAAHRGEAFAACQAIIDQVKERVPIWKRETYSDGEQTWVTCQHAGPPASP
jgi:molybdopterin synthase catalytic subunit